VSRHRRHPLQLAAHLKRAGLHHRPVAHIRLDPLFTGHGLDMYVTERVSLGIGDACQHRVKQLPAGLGGQVASPPDQRPWPGAVARPQHQHRRRITIHRFQNGANEHTAHFSAVQGTRHCLPDVADVLKLLALPQLQFTVSLLQPPQQPGIVPGKAAALECPCNGVDDRPNVRRRLLQVVIGAEAQRLHRGGEFPVTR